MTYKITRFYFNDGVPRRIIKTGLTREEAEAHCNNPETSSETCARPDNVAHKRQHGPWFDGFDEEKEE